MYTNELLEEKYKAQKALSLQARKENKDYLTLIEEEVRELFQKNGWNLKMQIEKVAILNNGIGWAWCQAN